MTAPATAPASAPGEDAPDVHGVVVRALGRTQYEPTWRAMQAFTAARMPATPDEIWLTEHPPIYTLGIAGRREHLLRERGIPALKVDRGGQITYHGPGQLVAYLLFDLRRSRRGIRDFVRSIEAAVVEWLDSMGISAYGKVSAPGVYVAAGGQEAKIAALGLKVRNGCTYHGLAVNVAMDLAPFADIDPCGFRGLPVTQLADFGVVRTVEMAGAELAPVLARRLTGIP
jgi:lipoyl(octanoyl) transferase